ncbi:phage tail protein [Citrobacter freundii]
MAADVVVSSIKSFPDATSLALVSDLQFNEPYSSAALNRKFRGIVNTGFYGGFLPSPAGGLNLKISSGEEGGTASIDIDKYYQLTIRQQADVTLPVSAGKKVIVVLEATYALGQETYQVNCKSAVQAVEIKFLEEGTALRQNQLELCTVTVPAGATELTEEMIDVSRRRNQTVGITLSSEIDSDAEHIGASSHAVKKAVKAARDETEKQIEELVDNAPASLDTLKKIADAINNDPDFFNTLNAVLALKAPLNDPAFTGIVTVPTPPLSVINQQVANTEFVHAAVAALVGSSPEALDTLAELAQALGNDPNFATTMLNALSGKQPLNQILTSLSGLNSAANKLAFFNGPNSMALANLTAVGRVLIGQETVAKVLEYLGLVETINRAAGAVQKSGDHMTGGLTFDNDSILAWVRNTDFAKIGFKNESDSDADSYMWFETGDNGDEYFKWRTVSGNTTKDLMTLKLGLLNVLVGAVINGSLGIGTTNALGGNSIALGDNDTGFKQNGDGVLDAYSNSRQVMRIVPGGAQIFGSTGSWINLRDQTCFSSVAPVSLDGASAIVRQEHPDRHFILGGLGNHQFGIYMINKSRSENGIDGQAYLDENGNWQCGGKIYPASYENFDSRYQPRGNYATQEWVLQNFVQNIRVSAAVVREFRDGWGYSANDAAFATAISMVGGSSNVGSLLVRYAQKQINNNWYNVTE